MLGPHIYGAGAAHVLNPVWEQGGRTNRDLVLEMCSAYGLNVMNTWFHKPDAKKVTHRAPAVNKLPGPGEAWDTSVFAELDQCLAPERWSGMAKDVESITGANLNSDHFPLEVTVALKLSARKITGHSK